LGDHTKLEFSPSGREHGSGAASGQTIAVIANVAWTATADAAWITITGGGNGNGTVTYSIAANGGPNPRTGTITISGGGLTRTFTVNQAGTVTGPVNDLFANRIAVTGTNLVLNATNVGATKEPGEPRHANNPGGKSIWWSWVAPVSGVVTLNTAGSNFDTLLGLYTGTSVSNLVVRASNDNASNSFKTSVILYPVVAGTEYQIAVDGANGDAGEVVLSLSLMGFGP
jgi:hypothetical protein